MKHQFIISLICMTGMLASCADTDMEQMAMQQPDSQAAYSYLKKYGVLKDYSQHIGTNIDVQEFLDKNMTYRLIASNFAEMMPANAFSHAKFIKANGNADTTVVAELTNLASNLQMHLVSTPLIWHQQQNASYLNGLLTPNVIRPDGDEGGYCLKLTQTQQLGSATAAQVAYTFAKTPRVEPGITYKLKMWVRGSANGSIQVATYSNGKGSNFKPSVEVTTDWTHVVITNTMSSGISGLTSILFNVGEYVGTLYVDDIELIEYDTDRDKEVGKNLNTMNTSLDDAETTAQSIAIQTNDQNTLEDVGVSNLGEGYDPDATYVEKTVEEKKAIMTTEMHHYLEAVLKAGKDVVSDWIVVADPLTAPDEDASNFFWQSYLGDTDYAVTAFTEAAKYTAGKLYIGATDLLNTPEDGEKLKTLVENLESKGARVDGYAISTTLLADDEQAIENLRNLLTSLSATGKSIRLVDVAVTLADTVTVSNVTEEQLQLQAKAVGIVVKTYMEAVPHAQRGGITLREAIDANDAKPIGLWDNDFNRKHAYGSVVEAIKP